MLVDIGSVCHNTMCVCLCGFISSAVGMLHGLALRCSGKFLCSLQQWLFSTVLLWPLVAIFPTDNCAKVPLKIWDKFSKIRSLWTEFVTNFEKSWLWVEFLLHIINPDSRCCSEFSFRPHQFNFLFYGSVGPKYWTGGRRKKRKRKRMFSWRNQENAHIRNVSFCHVRNQPT